MFLFRGLNESRYRHHNRFEIREKERPNGAPEVPPSMTRLAPGD